eukprot:5715991-Prymnesium_polylepis.2
MPQPICVEPDAHTRVPHCASRRQRGVLYGYATFLTGWRRSTNFQFGFGLYSQHAHRLWRQWRGKGGKGDAAASGGVAPSVDGPFPFVYGFGMVLSAGLARHLAASAAVARLVDRFASELKIAAPRHASACDPTGDGTIGWVLAHVDPPPTGVTLVDV